MRKRSLPRSPRIRRMEAVRVRTRKPRKRKRVPHRRRGSLPNLGGSQEIKIIISYQLW